MNKFTLLSDLLIILKLYAPKNAALFIFDPFGRLITDTDFPLTALEENAPKVLVSFADEVIYYKGMRLSDFDLVLDFGKSKVPEAFNQKKLSFINNPDKSMRWLFGDKNSSASFLSFYNTATLRAKLIAKVIKIIFKLGLKSLIRSGSFSLYHKEDLHITPLVNQVPHNDYSVFMGTAGASRTLLLELNLKGVSTHFVKIPIDKKSALTVANESARLNELAEKTFDHIVSSKTIKNKFKDVLITENIRPKYFLRSNKLSKIHYNALEEMAVKTMRFYHFKSTSFWGESLAKLALLKRGPGYDDIIDQLRKLKTELHDVKQVYTYLAHCDFTPWNIFVGQDKLYVYDWGKSQSEVPLLYDLFHFHFQTGILSKKVSFSEIKANIYRACKNEKIARLIKTYKINVEVYFKMYLFQAAVNNIEIFQKEKKLDLQHKWLLKGYKTALNDMQVYVTKEMMRKVFINEFNVEIKKTAHAFLKFTQGSLNNLPLSSDLDILVLKDDLPNMIRFCKKHLATSKVKVYRKSFMTTLELYFKDSTFLSLDLIHQFKRKGTQLLDAKPLLISAMPNSQGVMVPDIKFDFEYCLLFYALKGAHIPMKYQEYYNIHNLLQKNKIHNYINKKYKLKLDNYYEMFEFNAHLKSNILSKIESLGFNLNFNKLKNKVNYILDTLRDVVSRKGLVITFSGVDGVGKTTIVERVKIRLKYKYRKEVVLLRHRPGILPILSAIIYGKGETEYISSVSLPLKGTSNNVLSSIFRFSYYFTDYIIGQVYVYFKYVLRGKIVLYDRYYFDFINDAKRSNIKLNRRFLKAFYRFVFKPKLNFFLYADAATIRARKNEMMAPEIDKLTMRYKQLFGQMSKQYTSSHFTIIENIELEVTLNKIMKSYAKLA